MLDSKTVIRFPHDAISSPATKRGGRKRVQVNDPRTSVTMTDQGCEIVLFFEGDDLSGDAPLLEVRILPATDKPPFEPQRATPRLSHYIRYARAAIAMKDGDVARSLRALRDLGNTRRGLTDDFYHLIAESYNGVRAEGEKHPVKTLAATHSVQISTASRWITEAKRRGLISGDEAVSP